MTQILTEWPSDSFTVFNATNPSSSFKKVSVWKNKQENLHQAPKMYKISERNVQIDSNNIWADPNKVKYNKFTKIQLRLIILHFSPERTPRVGRAAVSAAGMVRNLIFTVTIRCGTREASWCARYSKGTCAPSAKLPGSRLILCKCCSSYLDRIGADASAIFHFLNYHMMKKWKTVLV